MRRLSWFTIPFNALLLSACAPELNLEPAPELEPVLTAFTNPTAVVIPDIMDSVDEGLASTRQDLEESMIFEELLNLVVDVQEELYNDKGELDLGGRTFASPNGGVTVDYICDGWSDPAPSEPDPANGTIKINMRLTEGSIAPLVWGTIDDCRYPVDIAGRKLEALYRGDISVYFSDPSTEGADPMPIDPDTDPYTLEVFFVADGAVQINGRVRPIDEVFSVTFVEVAGEVRLDALRILVELPDGTSFVYGFSLSTIRQEITDSTGTFRCSLEDRSCESPSGTFSW